MIDILFVYISVKFFAKSAIAIVYLNQGYYVQLLWATALLS